MRVLMTWFSVLIAVAVIAALAGLTGIKPRGTRPVARSGLMTAARVVLAILVIVIAYLVGTR